MNELSFWFLWSLVAASFCLLEFLLGTFIGKLIARMSGEEEI